MALHRVTDDFIAHLSELGDDADLDETTEFLVVAATLLDLKAARLLPDAEVEDAEEDPALLEARDLLFARLLQYRAYQQAAALFVELEEGAQQRFPRSVALEDRFAGLLPEVLLGVDAAAFAELAAAVFRPKPPPTVGLDHLHVAHVSVAEHAALLRDRLAQLGSGHVRDVVRRLRRPAGGRRAVPRRTGPVPAGRRRARPAGGVRRADSTVDAMTTVHAAPEPTEAARPGLRCGSRRRAGGVVAGRRRADRRGRARGRARRVGRARDASGSWCSPRATGARTGGSTCGGSVRAGGSTPATGTPRSSSACCWADSARG